MRRAVSLTVLFALFALAAFSGVRRGEQPRSEHAAATPAAESTVAALAVPPISAPQSVLAAPSARRFADPAILLEGGEYYAYATRNGTHNIPVMISTDLEQWTPTVDALPELPKWAGGRTWAPAVVRRGDQYVMWYTVRDLNSKRQCISVATAELPLGPFRDGSSGPAICQTDLGGSIDPDVFVDHGGAAYLLWKSDDNALGNSTTLWAAPLSADGTSVGGEVPLLPGIPGWQDRLVEGPAMTFAGGVYHLFYGANRWNTADAAIGYARCIRPLGPCREVTPEPWLASGEAALGPSGPHIFTDLDGVRRFAYHAWERCIGSMPCNRALYFGTLAFEAGRPRLRP